MAVLRAMLQRGRRGDVGGGPSQSTAAATDDDHNVKQQMMLAVPPPTTLCMDSTSSSSSSSSSSTSHGSDSGGVATPGFTLRQPSSIRVMTHIDRRRSTIDKDDSSEESIVNALAVLKKCQTACEASGDGATTLQRDEVGQLVDGFAKAFDSHGVSRFCVCAGASDRRSSL